MFCCGSLLGGWVSLREYWDWSTEAAVLFDVSFRERWEVGINCVVGGVVAGVNCVWPENDFGVGDKKIEA